MLRLSTTTLPALIRAQSSIASLRSSIMASSANIARLERRLALHPDPAKKRVAVLGAGRSSTPLIRYLAEYAEKVEPITVVVADADMETAVARAKESPALAPVELDVEDSEKLASIVGSSDVVVSMLPAGFHGRVMDAALAARVPMVTASYATPELRSAYQDRAEEAGIPIIMECGVDPGLDHMSAMALIDEIRNEGGNVREFRSYTGGLVAEESSRDNPWKYKISWNPRNVVLAGQGVSKYLQAGVTKFVPYNKLFSRAKNIVFPDGTTFEAYANRDSLRYIDAYSLQDASTVLRGTLRWPGYCEAWDVFVQLGLTDDSFVMENSDRMTYAEFLGSFLPWRESDSVELLLAYQLQKPMFSDVMEKVRWLGLFSDRRVNRKGTPASILESIIKRKWRLRPGDRDLIGMLHKISYVDSQGVARERRSALKLLGSEDDPDETAMARTVSLPVAIMTKRLLAGESFSPGFIIPTTPDIYRPVLDELSRDYNIHFEEHDTVLSRGIHADHYQPITASSATTEIDGSL